jgi:hypothetical protein
MAEQQPAQKPAENVVTGVLVHQVDNGRTTQVQSKKVVTGEVTERKKGRLQKYLEDALHRDLKKIKNYIIKDMLTPALKRAPYAILDILLTGDARRGGDGVPVARVSYTGYSNSTGTSTSSNVIQSRASTNYQDFEYENLGDAEIVIQRMRDSILRYRNVSVGDLLEFIGKTPSSADYKYGWLNLPGTIDIIGLSNGRYRIKLPLAMPLD